MEKNSSLPNNLEAEKGILSVLVASPEKFIEVADLLKVEDFYRITHQQIWQAMTNLYQDGKELDIVSIRSELKRIDVDPKPAIVDLAKCYEDDVFASNLLSLANDVKNKSLLRKIIKVAIDNSQKSRLDDANALKILGQLEQDLVNLYDTVTDDKPTDAEGILGEIENEMDTGEKNKWQGFKTDFGWLDEQTGGLIPTQVWIVGAYTGTGKTFFLLQLILNILKQKAKVMLFSTEMDRKMNMLRLLGNLAGLGTINILKNNLNEKERAELREATKTLKSYQNRLTIYDNVYTIEDIRLKAKKCKLQGGLNVIVVDFIQNLRGSENIYERMSNAALALQRLAQELNVTMIIASQVSQTSAGWSSKEAIEYKGAGEIAAIADVGIWIKKDKNEASGRDLVLRKVRHGVPGTVQTRITFPSGRMVDLNKPDKEKLSEYGDDGNVTDQL